MPHDQSLQAATRRNRTLLRIWLPLAAVWVAGAWFVGVREAWQLMGPPGLFFVVIGWWAHDPKRPFVAIVMGAVFAALGYLLFVK